MPLHAQHVDQAALTWLTSSCSVPIPSGFYGRRFNAFSCRYYKTGNQQIAGSLQIRRSQICCDALTRQHWNFYESDPEYQFRSDIYMAYLNDHIEQYRFKRDEIMLEATDAGESTKSPRLEELQELDENFSVIGLVKPLKRLSDRSLPQSKSSIIKKKYALRSRTHAQGSGMAQRISPQLLNLRFKDQDMRRVRKVALQPSPTLAGIWGGSWLHDKVHGQ